MIRRISCPASPQATTARPASFASALILLLFSLVTIAAPSGAQVYTATASPNPAAIGRVVYGCWTAPAGSPAFDWVVLAPVGSPSNEYVSFGYTGGSESGCASLSVPFGSSPGSYDVRYLLESTFTTVATSSPVAVVASPSSVFLSATPNSVVSGRQVYACWSATPGETSASDAVALFDLDQLPPTTALATQGTLGAESGCLPLTVPSTGDYELRYLSGGVLDVAAASLQSIASPGAYGVSASPNPVATGRVVHSCWTAPPGSPAFDWLVLVPVGSPSNQYVSLSYTGGSASGCVDLYVASPGSYEVRYLLESTFTDVAASSAIMAVAPPGYVSLTPTPSAVVGGRDVHACWSLAEATATSTDAVGLFDADLPPTPPLATRSTCGSASGCATFSVPAGSNFEVRYLAGGTLDIASQAVSTIASPGDYDLTATAIAGPFGPEAEVCWTAPPSASLFDWIVLVPLGSPSNSYVGLSYTGGTQNGCLTFYTGVPGVYEARYLLENSFTDVATSNEVALGTTGPLMHAHEWKLEVTADPQNHPRFDVGDEVTVVTHVPRSAPDRLPANPQIGDYGGGFVHLDSDSLDPAWTFGSPQPTFSVYDGFAGSDGIRFDAATSGRSLAMSCETAPSRFSNDGFKTRDMPVAVLDCPGGANDATIQDTSPAAVVSGELMCSRYLPEPALGVAIAAGCMMLSALRRPIESRGSARR